MNELLYLKIEKKIANSWQRNIIFIIFATAILTISAKIQVPFYPVPMTMQTLVVMLIGIISGWKLGSLTMIIYIAEGAIGIPVFAGTGAGPAYLLGPTGGYLIGFIFAAALTGYISEHGHSRSVTSIAVTLMLGHIVLFIPGFLWLSTLAGMETAYMVGVAPFYLATMLKTGLGSAIIAITQQAFNRR